MALAVAIQMDPIERIDIDVDSTFAMALEAQKRGHALWHYLVRDLTFAHGKVRAQARKLSVRREKGNHFTLGPVETVDLRRMDVVLMRQDPPFDMAYITATHVLQHIHPETLVVNDPAEVRNAPEKLFVTHFPDLMPPTLIASDRAEIDAFRAEHKDIIVKPLFGNGGAGVFHITPDDENLGSLLEMFTSMSREPVIVADEDHGRARALAFVEQQRDELILQRRVDRGRGFVGDDELGFSKQRARRGDTLLLTHRQRGDVARAERLQTERGEQAARLGLGVGTGAGLAPCREARRQQDVVDD